MLRWIVTAVLSLCLAGAAIAQSSNYQIRIGDTLGIEVLEDGTLNRNVLVLPDGSISFPLAGTIQAAGLSVRQLQNSLTQGLAPNFAATPSVFVTVRSVAQRAKARTTSQISIFLIGEVTNPGEHKVKGGTTLLQFLAQSGGFTRFAAKKRIQLRRTTQEGEAKVYKINYKSIEAGRNIETASAPLFDGDVIVVPERKLFE